jgi:hypothetical protein
MSCWPGSRSFVAKSKRLRWKTWWINIVWEMNRQQVNFPIRARMGKEPDHVGPVWPKGNAWQFFSHWAKLDLPPDMQGWGGDVNLHSPVAWLERGSPQLESIDEPPVVSWYVPSHHNSPIDPVP